MQHNGIMRYLMTAFLIAVFILIVALVAQANP